MGYKIVEIDNAWKIKLFIGNMQVFKGEDKITIPINDIDILIINNPQILISQSLLIELSINNKLVILCDNKHLPQCNVIPISGNYNSLKIIQKQIQWTDEFKNSNWQKIVKLKIESQIKFLNFFKICNTDKFTSMYEDVNSGDVTNREAMASKEYFVKIFGQNFERRSEKDSFNILVNSYLNYGYIILMSIVARSIAKNGLDNRIGLFHKSFNNHFALACDLMEPFRTIVDAYVFKMITKLKCKRNILDLEAKRDLIELFLKEINYANEKMSITLAIDKFVHSLINNELTTNINYLYNDY